MKITICTVSATTTRGHLSSGTSLRPILCIPIYLYQSVVYLICLHVCLFFCFILTRYGVPGTKIDAEGFEKVFEDHYSKQMNSAPNLLHHITTMLSPRLLREQEVSMCKLLQHEGEFIVTFPRAFHGGFSMGPNIGEAVNFAASDWISFGREANERYRSFARPSIFSHDRLVFTMANHAEEQGSLAECRLLLEELERLVDEECQMRKELIRSGVRDVSMLIHLPENRMDLLDKESANYDDLRLCHACKHVCFLSAVACECSPSRVSCLRHSYYMCRCVRSRRYLMLWCTKEDMLSLCRRVSQHCEHLTADEKKSDENVTALSSQTLQLSGLEWNTETDRNAEVDVKPFEYFLLHDNKD